MPNSQERNTVRPGERIRSVVALEILLRIVRKAVECFPGQDLESIVVFLTISTASAGSYLRDSELIRMLDEGPLPDEHHKPISRRAVAETTGLPRESVRRRIDSLLAAGLLATDQRGVKTMAGNITRGRNLEFARSLIRELEGAHAKLARWA